MKMVIGQDDVGFSFNALRPLWREFGVERAWLFGGRARGKAGADSDWDFLVEFAGRPGFSNFMGLKCALEDALEAKVDLLFFRATHRRVTSRSSPRKRTKCAAWSRARGAWRQSNG